ncbi:MAG: hypothetical protein CV089_07685 [Nitrospira sp. WS110]|nr:hypothetical protein [Nitrospira sp. WS110]
MVGPRLSLQRIVASVDAMKTVKPDEPLKVEEVYNEVLADSFSKLGQDTTVVNRMLRLTNSSEDQSAFLKEGTSKEHSRHNI